MDDINEIINELPEEVDIQGEISTCKVTVDGIRLFPHRSQQMVNHSPGGFRWGYDGSGPAQLALAILLLFMAKQDAGTYYQSFKSNVVAAWPISDFHVTINLKEEIRKIVEPK